MTRTHRFQAWVFVGLLMAGCAEEEVREPGLDDVKGYIPGRVYDKPATTARRSPPARVTEPTAGERLAGWDEGDDPVDLGEPVDPADRVGPVDRVERAVGDDPPAHRDPVVEPLDETGLEDRVLDEHNRIRIEAKLPRLEPSRKLQEAARRHALDMAKNQVMTHDGSDGTTPFDRMKAAGYNFRRAGENVAVGRFGVDRLMKGWMDSPHHKENILGSFSQVGVAYATGADGKRYWCVTFGFPKRR